MGIGSSQSKESKNAKNSSKSSSTRSSNASIRAHSMGPQVPQNIFPHEIGEFMVYYSVMLEMARQLGQHMQLQHHKITSTITSVCRTR